MVFFADLESASLAFLGGSDTGGFLGGGFDGKNFGGGPGFCGHGGMRRFGEKLRLIGLNFLGIGSDRN